MTVQLLPGSLRELGTPIVHVSFEKEENSRIIRWESNSRPCPTLMHTVVAGMHTHTTGALPPSCVSLEGRSPARARLSQQHPQRWRCLRHLHPSRLTEPMACWCESVKTQLTCLDKPWDSISILSSPAGAGRGWDFAKRYSHAGLPAFFCPVPQPQKLPPPPPPGSPSLTNHSHVNPLQF